MAGITAVLIRTAPPPGVTYQSSTAADGSFRFSGVAAGTYTVCVQAKAAGLLDPCQWSPVPPSVQVAAGQAAAPVRIALKSGTTLQIRLDDPAKHLRPSRRNTEPFVLVGVWSARNTFEAAPLKSQDAGGRTHEAFVPADTRFRVSVHSPDVRLADERNNPVPAAGAHVEQRIPANAAAPQVLTFRVTGRVRP